MISVVIPMKNEAAYIGGCLQSIVGQDYPGNLVEVIVVDGGSTDSSLDIVKEFIKEHQNIKLFGGPGVTCPAAMNIGIVNARGQVVSKIDAHGYVASDFLRKSVKYLGEEEGIKCVGGPITPVVEGRVAKANALARSCFFGVGSGVYSMGGGDRFVDTVQCGTYKKDVFGEVGLFDESMQFGEDEEINWRIRKKGYKIFSTPEVRFFYFPRTSFGKLFRQYFNYGLARVKVIRKHPDFFRLKHILPMMFLVFLFLGGGTALLSSYLMAVYVGVLTFYIGTSLAFSALAGAKAGWEFVCLLPISFAALHLGYGLGFFFGVLRSWRIRKIP